jgi:hypothetical protein
MADRPSTKFPFDQVAILSDPCRESRVSSHLIRLEFTIGEVQTLLERRSRLPSVNP